MARSSNAEKINIGIIGHGFVGKSVDYGFTHNSVEKHVVDPIYGTSVRDLPDCMFYFVCVPTPMGDDGVINSTILDNVMRYLLEYRNGIIIVKSTVTPTIIKKYEGSGVVYNPEFLTEKSANELFVNPQFHIFGGAPMDTALVKELYETVSLCTPCPVFEMSLEEASFVKYTINTFLALKVTFFNQLYDAVAKTDANFSTIIKAVGSDSRIGHSHTKVPGFDGKKGFGGACFPKDTAAFVNFQRDNSLTLLEECIRVNNRYRSAYELDEREKAQNVNYAEAKKEQ